MDSDEPRGVRIDSVKDMLEPVDTYILDRPVVGRVDACTRDLSGTRRRQAARLIMERTSAAVKAGYRERSLEGWRDKRGGSNWVAGRSDEVSSGIVVIVFESEDEVAPLYASSPSLMSVISS